MTFFLAKWLSSQLSFLVAVHAYKIHIFDEAFYSYYQNAYGHQNFHGCDMLRGALTQKHLNGVVLWVHVTNKIHISTCRTSINTTLGKVLT